MVCKHCGEELKKGSLYCQSCGKAVQIVPDYNKIEDVITDELNNIMLEDEDIAADDRQEETKAEPPDWMEKSWGDEEREPVRPKKKMNKKSVQLIAGIIATSLAIIAAIVVIIVVILNSNHDNSYTYQMEQGYEAVKNQDYDNAIVYFEKAATLDKKSTAAYWQLVDIYKELNKEDKVIENLKQIIEVDGEQTEAFSQLLSIYEANQDTKSIYALAKKATTKDAKEIFAAWLINKPQFSYQTGTYSEDIAVEITAKDAEKIYYTLNGEEATVNAKEYTGPIQLQGEGKKKIRAVAVNASGLVSDETIAEYVIAYGVPQEAEVTPDSGTYQAEELITVTVPDHCTAYYTLDGSVPTTASNEYKEPIPMPIGNNIFSVILVDDEGTAGAVVTKIYNMELSTDVSALDAENFVLDRLLDKREILDATGSVDGKSGKCVVQAEYVVSIASHQYYIVKKYYEENGIKEEESYAFAVDTSTGDVFQALKGESNSYILNAY